MATAYQLRIAALSISLVFCASPLAVRREASVPADAPKLGDALQLERRLANLRYARPACRSGPFRWSS